MSSARMSTTLGGPGGSVGDGEGAAATGAAGAAGEDPPHAAARPSRTRARAGRVVERRCTRLADRTGFDAACRGRRGAAGKGAFLIAAAPAAEGRALRRGQDDDDRACVDEHVRQEEGPLFAEALSRLTRPERLW